MSDVYGAEGSVAVSTDREKRPSPLHCVLGGTGWVCNEDSDQARVSFRMSDVDSTTLLNLT